MLIIGQQLKNARLNLGLTQEQLAIQTGLSRSSICFYERDERTPSVEALVSLSSVLNVSIDYLLNTNLHKGDKIIDISGLPDNVQRNLREQVRIMRYYTNINRERFE